jgi:Ca-activated chloride channel family protein
MTFANPHMLWLLLVIPPALLAFFWWAGRTRQRLLTQFIQARLLPTLTIGISATRQKVRVGCLVLAVVCLILALARPQWGFDWEEMKQRGLDIVVAIDTSKSMLAEDIAPNRLARAKLAALELMQRARSDRLGLVAFAGSAFLQCPLTIDDAAFRQSVEALNVNIIPQGGTAIAEAIETALTAFKEGDNYKVLVLLTDGEDHDSGALEAAEKAAKAGMRIFTIGIGTAEGELLRIKDAQGGGDYIRDEQGNVVKSHLNERLLQQIAGATEGGFYLPLRGAKAVDTLYDQGLAKLPKAQHEEKLVRRYHERYHWPLAVAIVLLVAEMLFPERKREPKGKSAAVLPDQAALPAAVPLLLMLLSPTALWGSPASALREYKAGNYDQALKEYEQLLKRKSDDPRLHFNAGAAAYRNRQFEEAAKQFNATLASPDLKLQGLGYYNKGNALYHLGERNPDPKKRTEAWEKAIQDYESTVKLNPQDADAKFNHDFVKRRLEELKQQQQQSQQNKSDQQKNQDQQQQQQNQQQQDQQKKDQQKKDQQKKDQQKKDQQKKDQQKKDQQQQQAQQNQSEQKKDSSQQEQQAQQKKQEEEKQQQQQSANQSQEQKDQAQKAQQSTEQSKDKGDEKEQEAAAAQAAGQMTPQQAQQLLDTQKGDEQMLPVQPGKPTERSRPIKDW